MKSAQGDRRITRSSSQLASRNNSLTPVSLVEIKKLSGKINFASSSVSASYCSSLGNLRNQNAPEPTKTEMTKKSKPNKSKPGVKIRKKRTGNFRVAYTNRKAIKLLSESGNNELSMDSMSFLTDEEKLLLSSWGLPSPVLTKYRQKGVTSLFQWQLDCLDNEKVLKGSNILYSAPTSAGKTLVAEILMLKRVLELGKKAMMILPFVSVAREKMYSLQELFGDIGIRVEGFMGSYNPPGGFQQVDIAVCTIEKANSLINRLLEEGGLSQLGTIVVDELHLIGDPHRGYLLELLLTKIRFTATRKSKQENHSMIENNGILSQQDFISDENRPKQLNIQIIGMSATLPNLTVLAKWLEAELVISDFRPVPLVERVKIGDSLYDTKLERVGPILKDSLFTQLNDPDHIISLSLETILDGHSILIFCPSKQICENTAVRISQDFFAIGNPNATVGRSAFLGEKLRQQLHGQKISEVLSQLSQCPTGLDDALRKAVSFGVAFHHAGLTYDEREVIESAFKRGIIRVMIATSTLSAGVNLPARRVLIVTPTFDALDVLTYRQMSGRAGRKGIDTEGESILISDSRTQKRAIGLIQANLPPVSSALFGDSGISVSMKRALLEVIASGVVQNPAEVKAYAQCTLLSHISESEEEAPDSQKLKSEAIAKCLEFLEKNEFIRLHVCESDETSAEYMTTQLGSACMASSLSPDEGIAVFKELEKARRCFVLENELHVVYQVTPIYIADQWRNLDWSQFLTIWQKLSPDQKEVGRLIGVQESFIVKAMMGLVSWRNPTQSSSLNMHQRFYTALALNDLVNEMPITFVAEKYAVNKGVVQNLQQAASTFAGMVTAFCNRLGWSNLELLLSQFQDRLQFGVQRELVDLVKLELLNGQRARILHNAGIKTISDLATSQPSTVAHIFNKARPFSSNVHGGKSSKSIWMLGKKEGLTENEAAQMIVQEARNYLQPLPGFASSFFQIELGLVGVQFRKDDEDNSDKENKGIKEEEAEEEVSHHEIILLDESTEVLMEIVNSFTERSCNDVLLGQKTFHDDSADPIVTGFLKSPYNQSNSLLTTVTPHVTALKHSTPIHSHSTIPDTSAKLETPVPLISHQTSQLEQQYTDEFDFENEFLNSKFETSVYAPPNDDEEYEMESMTTSFMDVSIANDNEEEQNPTEEKLMLSESILIAAAALAAEGSDTEDSIKFHPKSTDVETLQRLGSQRMNITSQLPQITLPISSSSDDDEDEFQVLNSLNQAFFLTPSEEKNISQQDQLLRIFGHEFKVKKIKSLESLSDDAFKSDEAIGFGLIITPPTSQPTTNGIGNRILGKRPSTTPKRDRSPHGVAFCNGSTETIWVYKWKDSGRGLEFLMKKFQHAAAPLAILDGKLKLTQLLKNSSMRLEDLPTDKNVWDPKIAQWLHRFDEDRAISKNEMVRMWLEVEEVEKILNNKLNGKTGNVWTKEVIEALIGWKLMIVLKEKLTVDGLWLHFIDIEAQSIRPLLLMELNGFGVDEAELLKAKEILEFKSAILELRAYQITGRQFNLSSSKEIRHILCHDLGLSGEMTGRGTGKDVLRNVDHELVTLILEWRKVTGALNKVVLPFTIENVQGRIHGHYAHLTVTGRVVMSEPSLQCVPRDFSLNLSYNESQVEEIRLGCKMKFGTKVTALLQKIEKLTFLDEKNISLRNAFVPCNGFLLLSADYSQLELRILAHLAQDKKLLHVLNTPSGDVFREIAAQWKGVSESDVTDEMRQEAKGITYGIIYGMGVKTLSDQLEVSEQEAAEFIRGFMWTYPAIRTFIDQTIKACREVGYVETISGRRRYLEHINSNIITQRTQAERQAVNSRIQGSASDLVKRAMILIQENLFQIYGLAGTHVNWSTDDTLDRVICFPILNLHDELIYEVRESHIVPVAKEIKHQMESCLRLNVQTPVVIKTGPTWGKLKSL